MPRTRAVNSDNGEARTEDAFETRGDFCLAACKWIRDVLGVGTVVAENGSTAPAPLRILEPSAGSGNWVRAARAVWPSSIIIANDLRDCRTDLTSAGANVALNVDFLKIDPSMNKPVDLILGNPPYGGRDPVPSHLDPCNHILHGREFLKPGGHLVNLLKLAFLCGLKRLEFQDQAPLYALQPTTPRLDFIVPAAMLAEWKVENDARLAAWKVACASAVELQQGQPSKPALRKPSNDTAEYGLFVWKKELLDGDADKLATPITLHKTIKWTNLVTPEEVAAIFPGWKRGRSRVVKS